MNNPGYNAKMGRSSQAVIGRLTGPTSIGTFGLTSDSRGFYNAAGLVLYRRRKCGPAARLDLMYEFGIGHYLFYPLGILLFSTVFFLYGYRFGRRWERRRILIDGESAG